MAKQPRFSIVVPAHDEERYIQQCLDSILGQSFKDVEIVLVTDSCTDRTEDIARDMGVEPMPVTLASPGLTRNVALERARGDYLLFLDADDYYLTPDALHVLDMELAARPVDLLHFGFMAGPRLALAFNAHKYSWANVWSKAFRRETFARLRFDDSMSAEDVAYLKAAMEMPGVTQNKLDIPLVQYRFPRSGSLSDRYRAGTLDLPEAIPAEGALA